MSNKTELLQCGETFSVQRKGEGEEFSPGEPTISDLDHWVAGGGYPREREEEEMEEDKWRIWTSLLGML